MVPLWTKNLQLAHTPTCIKISVFMRQVQKFIENSADEEFDIDGVVIEDSVKYYVLHDRVRTSNVLTRLGSVKGTAKDASNDEYTQFKIGGLEFFKEFESVEKPDKE